MSRRRRCTPTSATSWKKRASTRGSSSPSGGTRCRTGARMANTTPSISDILESAERTAKVLQKTIRKFGPTDTGDARLGGLDALEQSLRTADLARQYILQTLASKRRKEDAP